MSLPSPLAAALLALALSGAPSAAAIDLTVTAGGGTLLPWEAPGELGNALFAGALVGTGDLELGLLAAGVLPDARTQAAFAALWVEGRWYPWGRDARWAPYGALGLGLALSDGLSAREARTLTGPRWASDDPSGLATLGVGLRYGAPEGGLQLSVDARAYNTTHGGLNLAVAHSF